MDYYQLIATISIVIQIIVLIMLFGGVWLKTKKKFRQHGITMFAAILLHAVTILAWMMPSFSRLFTAPGAISLVDLLTIGIIIHALAGVIAVILGIWIVASWRLRVDVKKCFAKKNSMRVTITMWIIALAIGIILYLKIMQVI
ncbi:hypothetical protein E2P61_06680 [Candidatus Bathyarchaeota archaeon]|nr:hypothetical protein E2P61_06680 [Candidatus Bathyarchaeota archaeon]